MGEVTVVRALDPFGAVTHKPTSYLMLHLRPLAMMMTTTLHRSPGAARGALISMVGGSDYVGTATALFANVRLPASILAGALVPLGFGFPLPTDGAAFEPPTRRRLIRAHRVVAAASYASLLICIVYSSVSINSLAEVGHEPATSVKELILHEYELAWLATNVNFLFGLAGALIIVTLRALLTWEVDEGRVAGGFSGAALLLMSGVVDEQVKSVGYAPDLLGLIARYVSLEVGITLSHPNPLRMAGLATTAASLIAAGRLLASEAPPPAGAGGDARGREAAARVLNAGDSSGQPGEATAVDAAAVGGDGGDGGGDGLGGDGGIDAGGSAG